MLPDLSDIRKISTTGRIQCKSGPGGERFRAGAYLGGPSLSVASQRSSCCLRRCRTAPAFSSPPRNTGRTICPDVWNKERLERSRRESVSDRRTHLVIFHALHGQMVAVDPHSVPEDAQTVLLLLLKHLKVNRKAYYMWNMCLNCGRESHSIRGSTECQHRVNSSRHQATSSGLPRTCWCALIPIPDESSPAARCWICTASLKAKPAQLHWP